MDWGEKFCQKKEYDKKGYGYESRGKVSQQENLCV